MAGLAANEEDMGEETEGSNLGASEAGGKAKCNVIISVYDGAYLVLYVAQKRVEG